MKEDFEANITHFGRRLLLGVLADNPAATLVGAGIGIISGTAYEVIHQLWTLPMPTVATWIWVVGGITAFNVRRAITHKPLPSNVEQALSIIERARLAGVSSTQINAMYRRLFDAALEQSAAGVQSAVADAEREVAIAKESAAASVPHKPA